MTVNVKVVLQKLINEAFEVIFYESPCFSIKTFDVSTQCKAKPEG